MCQAEDTALPGRQSSSRCPWLTSSVFLARILLFSSFALTSVLSGWCLFPCSSHVISPSVSDDDLLFQGGWLLPSVLQRGKGLAGADAEDHLCTCSSVLMRVRAVFFLVFLEIKCYRFVFFSFFPSDPWEQNLVPHKPTRTGRNLT